MRWMRKFARRCPTICYLPRTKCRARTRLCVTRCAPGWPLLGQARGKVFLALDEDAHKVALYRGSRRSLEGRAMFVNTDEASPAAAYLTLNDPLGEQARIARAVADGYLVRTRADADTRRGSQRRYAPQAGGVRQRRAIRFDRLSAARYATGRNRVNYRVTLPALNPSRSVCTLFYPNDRRLVERL